MKFIIIYNLVATTLIGIFHLMLVDISLPLKVASFINILLAVAVYYKSDRKIHFSSLALFLSVMILLLIQFLYSLDGQLNRLIIDFIGLGLPIAFFLLLSSGDSKVAVGEGGGKLLTDLMLFIIIWSIGVAVFMNILRYSLNVPINLTFGSPLIALAASISVYKKQYVLILTCLLIVLISGKRSIMILTILCSLTSYIVLLCDEGSIKAMGRSLITTCSVCFVLGVALTYNWDAVVEVNPKLKKVEYLFSDDADLYQKSTGRTDEIMQAVELIDTNSFKGVLLGKGLGTEFDIYLGRYDISKEKNNIHFTPLNIYLKYGLLFTLLFYIYFLLLPFQRRLKSFTPINIYCFYYISFYTLTNYGVAVDYSYWALLALLVLANKRANT